MATARTRRTNAQVWPMKPIRVSSTVVNSENAKESRWETLFSVGDEGWMGKRPGANGGNGAEVDKMMNNQATKKNEERGFVRRKWGRITQKGRRVGEWKGAEW